MTTKLVVKTVEPLSQELRQIREAVKFDLPSMAAVLGLPYTTYRNYEYGHRPVPDDVIAAARQFQKDDRTVMRDIRRMIEKNIDRQYPQGIPSE
jgi:hypothetical protein